ncbi:hypothetical protein ACTXGK_12725 [Psychrobacter sp. T6-5]|uniref:hypothetical protein n=1 Tax=Psychrobacter sp. T6-5 TaxID=3457451 RepID=UPI003FD1717C
MTTLNRQTPTNNRDQRKVIDITEIDDDEVIILPTIILSDIACEISGAINVLNDIGNILHLIQQDEASSRQASSMARLTNDATDRWTAILGHQLDAINDAMTQSKFAKVGE